MPKKYISIQIGSQELKSDISSQLLITFHSICTTSINDKIYKLSSKEADPITEQFSEKDLLIKVNANKSDRIQLRLQWVDVTVIPFSKKISYDNEIRESPLPALLQELYEEGLDIRCTQDPLLASHYLTIVDKNDYNLQIALLRAIPVVSYAWVDAMRESPDKVDEWLLHVNPENLFPGTRNDYIFPNPRRRELLVGANTFMCFGTESKHTKRLRNWLECLGSSPQTLKVANESETEDILRLSDDPYVFVIDDDKQVDFLRDRANSVNSLWDSVAAVSITNLKVFQASIKRESQASQAPSTQRKKRRKLEKVGDTDFFLFGLVSQAPTAEAEPNVMTPDPMIINSVSANAENAVSEDQPDLQVPSTSNNGETNEPDSSKTALLETTEQYEKALEHDQATVISDTELEAPKRPHDEETFKENKKPKTEVASKPRRIIPLVSLVDAVLSAKKDADEFTKRELGLDLPGGVNEKLDKLVIVEEFDLAVRKRIDQQEGNPNYEGRKNFKNFRKAQPPSKGKFQSYILLENHDSGIHFEDTETPKKAKPIVKGDFEKELKSVKGYQPEESQLFVQPDSDDDEEPSFSFLTGVTNTTARRTNDMSDNDDDDDDDDDDVRFAFSRK